MADPESGPAEITHPDEVWRITVWTMDGSTSSNRF